MLVSLNQYIYKQQQQQQHQRKYVNSVNKLQFN